MQTFGIAIGVGVSGGLVDAAGASATFLAAAAAASLAVLVVVLRRDTLGAQRLQPA